MGSHRARRRPSPIIVVPATRRQHIVALLVLTGTTVAAWALWRTNPADVPWLPRCPSALLLGLQCPGCGSTRAVHHLLHLDLAAAWRHNPALLVLGLPALAVLLAAAALTLASGRHLCVALGRGTGTALAILLVVYMLLRNIPHAAFDAWRPPPIRSPEVQGPAMAPINMSPR